MMGNKPMNCDNEIQLRPLTLKWDITKVFCNNSTLKYRHQH